PPDSGGRSRNESRKRDIGALSPSPSAGGGALLPLSPSSAGRFSSLDSGSSARPGASSGGVNDSSPSSCSWRSSNGAGEVPAGAPPLPPSPLPAGASSRSRLLTSNSEAATAS